MIPHGIHLLRYFLVLALAIPAACLKTPSAPEPQEATSITLSPPGYTFTAVGQHVQINATALDQNSKVIVDAPVEWSTGDRSIATVGANGLVTAVSNGTTRITAASGSISKYAEVQVDTERTSTSTDRAALVVFYGATGGPGWTNDTNWLSDAPLREWRGVTTDTERRVTSLRLGENNLSGSIPPEVARLSELTELDLEKNRLTGGIPAELGRLNHLGKVSLGYNELDGRLPLELRRLRNLTHFLVSHNKLSGVTTSVLERMTNLEVLNISNNQFTGNISSRLNDLSNLEILRFDHNQFTGSIPNGLSALSNLRLLDLSNNQLTSVIPEGLGRLENLETLSLSDNQLTGEIPSSMGGLESIERVRLQNNRLEGRVPPELGELTSLKELALSNNPDLTGPLPFALTRLNLEYLSLSATQLCTHPEAEVRTWLERIPRKDGVTDCMPSADREALVAFYHATGGPDWTNNTNWLSYAPLEDWYGVGTDAFDRVVSLRLNDNGLAGILPPELGNLERLETLSLGDNNLRGNIPPEFGDLVNLTLLAFSNNELSGAIPVEITRLRNLRHLYIYGNRLTGTIPAEIGRLVETEYLVLTEWVRNTNLCAPLDEAFQMWLEGTDHDVTPCDPASEPEP